jgi:long-subunit acyl-CoA synthetase (AMP-forming)
VGGAKVAPQIIDAARAVGLPVFEGYGLSECGSVVALNTPAEDLSGSVGRVLPHLKVRVEAGEIVVGPRPFLGYVGGSAQTGPVATGDLGEVDADGWVRINGRRSNLIVTGLGRNVAPEWVESELLAEPEIVQAAVFGEAAADLCAVVVPRAAALPPEAIGQAVARANSRLPAYARISRWRGVAPFDPRRGEATANGRPRRDALHAAYRDFIDQRA